MVVSLALDTVIFARVVRSFPCRSDLSEDRINSGLSSKASPSKRVVPSLSVRSTRAKARREMGAYKS